MYVQEVKKTTVHKYNEKLFIPATVIVMQSLTGPDMGQNKRRTCQVQPDPTLQYHCNDYQEDKIIKDIYGHCYP